MEQRQRFRHQAGRTLAAFAAVLAISAPAAGQGGEALSCGRLAELVGGDANPGGELCRVTVPRDELAVTLLGADLPPGMGLTSWAAFLPTGGSNAIVMGDLALTSGELPRVMKGLRAEGIDVTAVHRHMRGESPEMSFMHYMGRGDAVGLATKLGSALGRAPSTRVRLTAGGDAADERSGVVAGVACSRIRAILGGAAANTSTGPGYCKVSMPRSDLSVRVRGTPVPASMGIGSWFAFRQTTGGDDAVVTGDLALTQAQVNPAIAALVERDVDVVALHNHMLFDEPRIVFFHFQARGEPTALARALRAGLDAAAAESASAAGADPTAVDRSSRAGGVERDAGSGR